MPYIGTVATIFFTAANDFTKEDTRLGIDTLKMTLRNTPDMLIFLLQLETLPFYREPVLSLSIFAALNIFDRWNGKVGNFLDAKRSVWI